MSVCSLAARIRNFYALRNRGSACANPYRQEHRALPRAHERVEYASMYEDVRDLYDQIVKGGLEPDQMSLMVFCLDQ
jgi:hypothetical protein